MVQNPVCNNCQANNGGIVVISDSVPTNGSPGNTKKIQIDGAIGYVQDGSGHWYPAYPQLGMELLYPSSFLLSNNIHLLPYSFNESV